jgi:hypothetical protein
MNATPLEARLQQCSLHSLLLVTTKVLTRSGFGDVMILDRRHPRQKSRFGGHELVCECSVGSVQVQVIVKVINDVIRLRMLDELAGAIDRTQSEFGLIISPHHLSANAARWQAKYRRSRLKVITGPTLAEMLTTHGIGVRSKGELDYAFFEELEEQSDRVLAFIDELKKGVSHA